MASHFATAMAAQLMSLSRFASDGLVDRQAEQSQREMASLSGVAADGIGEGEEQSRTIYDDRPAPTPASARPSAEVAAAMQAVKEKERRDGILASAAPPDRGTTVEEAEGADELKED